jgi:dephospho-CoA kinase
MLPPGRGFLAVGVTGGIGSGKSALCVAFADLGRLVLPADRIARDLTENDPAVLEEIVAAFGRRVLTGDGALDRKALAAIVFRGRAERERLNRIIHPRVFAMIGTILGSERPERLRPYTIHEAALIYESGIDHALDYVIVVDAPEEERIRRVMLRDGCSRGEVEARIAAQMSVRTKRARADFIVENAGDMDGLASQAVFLDRLLRSMAERRLAPPRTVGRRASRQ